MSISNEYDEYKEVLKRGEKTVVTTRDGNRREYFEDVNDRTWVASFDSQGKFTSLWKIDWPSPQ